MSGSPAAPITADAFPDPVQAPAPDVTQDWAERCLSDISARADAASHPEIALREKRASPRHPASGGALIHPPFGAPVACTLVDRSEGGARLRVLSVLGVPDEFLLDIGHDRMRARVAWRSPNELGVALSPA